jgi:hypothetical protein
VLFGFVLLFAGCSAMRGWFWAREIVVAAMRPHRAGTRGRTNRQKGDSMYGKFSLATVVTAAALALAAPAVAAIPYLSHGQGVDESAFSGAAPAAEQPQVIPYASQGVGVDKSQFSAADIGSAAVHDELGLAARGIGPEPAAATGPTEVDWPQLGIGVGVGIALALALLLTVRLTRVRPLPR